MLSLLHKSPSIFQDMVAAVVDDGVITKDVTDSNFSITFFKSFMHHASILSCLTIYILCLHFLPSNGLPSWCYVSLLSAGQINPCFHDMFQHLSRMCVDNHQQMSLIKGWRDTDLNIFAAGGGLQCLCHVIFIPPLPTAQC